MDIADKMTDNESWHLSKSVPITLIFGLITQGAAIVWTVSMMMGDIERNRTDIRQIEERVTIISDIVHNQAVAMARIDENINAIRGVLERLERDRETQ
jgi:type VI protein secretion system component VasK